MHLGGIADHMVDQIERRASVRDRMDVGPTNG
jgi:hypothetical protein